MRAMLAAVMITTLLCVCASAQAHTCGPVAPNERTVSTNVACWRVSELAFGAKQRLSNVRWHGQDFNLYGYRCKALNTFYTNGQRYVSTWHFDCERGGRYATFFWRFLQ
jgi:hypothetical protein